MAESLIMTKKFILVCLSVSNSNFCGQSTEIPDNVQKVLDLKKDLKLIGMILKLTKDGSPNLIRNEKTQRNINRV